MEGFIIDIWWDLFAVIVFALTGTVITVRRKRRAKEMTYGKADRHANKA